MSSTSAEGSGSVSGAPDLSGDNLPSDLREGYAEVGGQRLHYVEAGEGPLVVLLHGFPEFWYAWRQQIAPLAAAGFVGTTWPVISQSNSIRTAASCCFTPGAPCFS